MHPTTGLLLAGVAGLAAASPVVERAVASFPAGTTWDIVLNDESVTLDELKSAPGAVIDIDLFNGRDRGWITELAKTKTVICYFSAGSREEWREDDDRFTSSDYGQAMEDWEGEWWINVRSSNVRTIMEARIRLAAESGCHAVDPDNIDGFNNNQDGFGYPESAYVDYVKFLASTAAANNLAIGLKNSISTIDQVIDVVQFAVNEQCHEYEECGGYKPFTDANKAVFNIEYDGYDCESPEGVVLSQINKPSDQDLNTIGGQCN